MYAGGGVIELSGIAFLHFKYLGMRIPFFMNEGLLEK